LPQFYITPSFNTISDIHSLSSKQSTPGSYISGLSKVPSQIFSEINRSSADYYNPSKPDNIQVSASDFISCFSRSDSLPLASPLPPPPVIHQRRILVCHGGLSCMIPSLNVSLEMPQMERFDYFRECEDPNTKKFIFGHYRKRFF
jgi:hypothetical protein